jgi:non-heme chloroperoxidase
MAPVCDESFRGWAEAQAGYLASHASNAQTKETSRPSQPTIGDSMRIVLALLAILAVAVLGAFGAVLAFDAPRVPPAMASVEHAFDHADLSKAPPMQHFTARDGTKLVFRAYPGPAQNVVVLIHGSSGTSASMHLVAQALHARGATVYALGMRGHDGTGRSGDIDYIGQLDDDIVDFVKTLGPKPAGERRTLLGFSSGGGFVLRFAGGPNAQLFDRFVLVSPQLPATSPVMRPNAGGWVAPAIPRIVALTILSRANIHSFDGLPVLAFAVPPEMHSVQTAFYTYRMFRNFGPTNNYLDDLRRAPGPVVLLAGTNDEIFYSDRYAALLKPVRPDLAVTLVPGMGHMDMTVKPAALDAIVSATLGH